jgi:mannose-6-phosphate isomerase-like protein (cupin superfamily)
MLIKKSEAEKKQNSGECTVWEYEYPSTLFSFARAYINGRYPEEERVANLECEEVYFVLSGSGTIHSEKGDFQISEGDLYFFEKGERYWIHGQELSLVLVNAPPWNARQHVSKD